MQVHVQPAEHRLQDGMQLIQGQVGGKVDPTPDRRLDPFEVHPNAQGDRFAATRRRRDGVGVCCCPV